VVTRELLDFIKYQFGQGIDQISLTKMLTENGWDQKDIEEAFSLVSSIISPPLQEQSQPPQTQTPSITSLPAATELLANAWQILKQRFWTVSGILSIPFIPYLILFVLAGLLAFGSLIFANKPSPEPSGVPIMPPLDLKTMLPFIILYILSILAYIFIASWSQIALLYTIKNNKENIGIRQSYKKALRKILPYWWTLFLLGLVVTGGLMLLLIPGIIFIIWFMFAAYILILEDTGGLNALLKSREYVEGHWWGVLWRYIFIMVFFIIILVIPNLIIQLLKLTFLNFIFSLITYFVVTPLIVIYTFLLYDSLRMLKGQFTFVPAKKSRTVFALVAVLGGIIIPLTILGTIALIAINPSAQINKANDAKRMQDQVSVRYALEAYLIENGRYPENLYQLVPKYLKSIPSDPKTKLPYFYRELRESQDYEFCIDFSTKTNCTNAKTNINVNYQYLFTTPFPTIPSNKSSQY